MASVNLDISSRLDITCRKNDTFSLDLNVKDPDGDAIDLSDYDFVMEVRASTDATATIIASGDIDFTKNADSTTGKLNISIPFADMDKTAGIYVYDLQAIETDPTPDVKTTWLYGTFTINEDVTE